MPVSISSLKVGETIYNCHRHKLGNTTASELGVWKIDILEVDLATRMVRVSWNNNPSQWKGERYFEATTVRRSPPEWVNGRCYFCKARRHVPEGHAADCAHPKVRTRVRKVDNGS